MANGEKKARRRSDERGFTLVELLVVLVILAALVLLGYTALQGYHDRAADAAARAGLRQALPAAEAYFTDNGTYAGMDGTTLAAYDSALPPALGVVSSDGSSYCLSHTVRGRTWSIAGPGASADDYLAGGACA